MRRQNSPTSTKTFKDKNHKFAQHPPTNSPKEKNTNSLPCYLYLQTKRSPQTKRRNHSAHIPPVRSSLVELRLDRSLCVTGWLSLGGCLWRGLFWPEKTKHLKTIGFWGWCLDSFLLMGFSNYCSYVSDLQSFCIFFTAGFQWKFLHSSQNLPKNAPFTKKKHLPSAPACSRPAENQAAPGAPTRPHPSSVAQGTLLRRASHNSCRANSRVPGAVQLESFRWWFCFFFPCGRSGCLFFSTKSHEF